MTKILLNWKTLLFLAVLCLGLSMLTGIVAFISKLLFCIFVIGGLIGLAVSVLK